MSETAERPELLEVAENDAFLRQLSNISARSLPEGFPGDLDLEEVLFKWARLHVPEGQQDLFCRTFSLTALQEAFESGQPQVAFTFDSLNDENKECTLTLRFLSDADTGDLLCVSSLKETEKDAEEAAAAGVRTDRSFDALTRGYLLFFQFDPDRPRLVSSDLIKNRTDITQKLSFPCSFSAFMKALAARYVRPAWEEEFLALFSVENIKNAISQNRMTLRHTFSSDEGNFRLDVFLPQSGAEDRTCFFGLCRAEAEESNSLSVMGAGDSSVRSVVDDLQMEMQMERAETKKKHRRNTLLLLLLAIVVGVVGGAVLDKKIPYVSDLVGSFLPDRAQEEPSATPPPAEEVEIVVPETVVSYVPFTGEQEFTAEVLENGTARINASSDTFSSLTVKASVPELLGPEWFAKQYAAEEYPLDGTEAAVHISLSWSTDGDLTSLIPQEAFTARVTDAEGNTLTGYQLTDQPMGGSYNAGVASGNPADVYKRYAYTGDARYFVLGYYENAIPHELWFALRYDDPNAEQAEMQKGDKGDRVAAMKAKLLALGYLTEKQAKGDAFNADTVKAVQAAQEAFGMEKTGVADTEFLKKLYSE